MHTSPDLLALMALGEDAGVDEDLVHIADCPHCRAELAAFTAAAGTARRVGDRDVLVVPRDEVWLRISGELQLDGGRVLQATEAVAAAPPPTAPADPAATRPSDNRRSLRVAAFCLAAALALVIGLGLGFNANRLLPGATEVASVPLNALPNYSGSSGTAKVLRDRDGNLTLVVTVSSPEPATGPREVWMTNTAAEPMVAMGYLRDGTGSFPISPDLNLQEFRLIDISQEPVGDDSFAHSGKSMLRGKLPV